MSKVKNNDSAELKAVGTIYSALKPLDQPVQLRALRYAAEMLGLNLAVPTNKNSSSEDARADTDESASAPSTPALPTEAASDDVDGINAVALKWMKRSGLDSKILGSLFSLGIDEIDLVAKSVPGKNKKERMRNVVLLKGIAAYLGSGVARVSYEQLKEACLHYDAYDGANFASYLKSFAAEVGGTKESGFTLTARGLTAATDLIKQMLA